MYRNYVSEYVDQFEIDEWGLLYFKPVGGHDSPTPLGQTLWLHGRERVAGVVGRKAIHLTA